MEKVGTNICDNGNISAACNPIALGQANSGGRLEKGDLVLLADVGGGLSSAILYWNGGVKTKEITLIRHAEVAFKHNKSYRNRDFKRACLSYDTSPIVIDKNHHTTCICGKLFVSSMQRTHDTAEFLLPSQPYEINSIFDEVPMTPFTNWPIRLPTSVWLVMARLQWFFNSKHQHERRCDTVNRAKAAADLLEKQTVPSVVICHGFFMWNLVREMKNRGYCVSGKRRYRNLDEIHLTRYL